MNGPASITVQATILRVYSRRPNDDGSEWIAAKIGAGGFSSASGVAREPFKKGDLVEMIGRPSVYKGERQIKFAFVRRIDPSPLDGAASALAKAGVAKSHVDKLRAELGDDFAKRLAVDPTLIEGRAFSRWRDTTRRKVVETCNIIAGSSERLKSLRAVIADAARIAKIEDATKGQTYSAYSLVRHGLATLNEADWLAGAPGFVMPSDPIATRAHATLWQYLNDRAKTHTAHAVPDIAAHLNKQHAIGPDGFDKALAQALEPIDDEARNVERIGSLIALTPLLKAERFIWRSIPSVSEALEISENSALWDVKRRYRSSVALNQAQIDAVSLALGSPVSFIAGGPGTGKTTICEAIAAALGRHNVLGAALANRAANNLGKRAKIETANITKLLYTKALAEWVEAAASPEALIVDESSMIGSRDFASIIRLAWREEFRRLIFVGVEAQLPPIEAGSPFADIVQSGKASVARLDRIYRFAEGGGVALLCRDVRRGGPFTDFTSADYPGVSFLTSTNGEAVNLALEAYTRLISAEADPLNIAIIAPFKTRGDEAVRELNFRVRRSLGRSGPIEPGELVIAASADLGGVSNGVRGIVSRIGPDAKAKNNQPHAFIDFEDRNKGAFPLAPHDKGPCAGIDYGYALTVHKFQGSQARHIIAVIPANSDFLFGKPLLYTAISRAQVSLTLIGEIEAIPRIAAREADARETALQLMLRG
ncbi:MAG: AAA family ATPase [Roseiarcus sp.]